MRIWPHPEPHPGLLHHLPQLRIANLLRLQHDPIREIARRKRRIPSSEKHRPTRAPQPIGSDYKIDLPYPAVFNLHLCLSPTFVSRLPSTIFGQKIKVQPHDAGPKTNVYAELARSLHKRPL